MKDSTLINVLRSFTPDEIKSFRKFVYSPFHNERKDVAKFYDVIRKYYPGYDDSNFTKEKIFRKLHPGKKFDDGVIRKLSSYLLKLAEEFLSLVFYRYDEYFQRKFLVEELNARKLYGHFNKRFAALYDDYENFKGQFDEYFLNKYYLENTRSNNLLFTRNYHKAHEAMEDRASYLIYFSLITVFYNYMNLNKEKNKFTLKSDCYEFFKVYIENVNFEKIMDYMKGKKDKNYPFVAVYYYSLMAGMNNENEKYFAEFQQQLKRVGSKLSWIDNLNLHIDLQDICYSYIVSGKDKFRKDLIGIYNRMLSNRLYSYYPDGHFVLALFSKMLKAALHLNEIKWAEDLVRNYICFLPDENKENTLHFSRALICFHKKEFESSLEEISRVNYNVFTLKLNVRQLMAMLFYELNYHDQLYSHFDSYRHFLAGNEVLSDKAKDIHNQFITILNHLLKIKLNKDHDSLPILKKEISMHTDGASKDWLMEKAEQLRVNG